MIQALLLKYLFGGKFKIVFSSAAQRKRSKFTLWLTRRMDAVVAMCKASASYLEKPPTTIIYHGINIDVFTPAKDKATTWQNIEFSGKPSFEFRLQAGTLTNDLFKFASIVLSILHRPVDDKRMHM